MTSAPACSREAADAVEAGLERIVALLTEEQGEPPDEAGVAPWNFPVTRAMWRIAPALRSVGHALTKIHLAAGYLFQRAGVHGF
ncbi:hypothetical protein AB0K16_10420 [Nonomuraea jabiensis]|uniref:hypothetical protein n=1 Tax=Nonomuraea jabiensis TaxID=882448 RepID=UPI00344A7016